MVAGCSSTHHAPLSPKMVPAEQHVAADDGYIVEFRERRIDLEPYVQGFPYSGFNVNLEHQHLLYFETTPQGKWLYHLAFEKGEQVDLSAGKRVHSIDWARRSFWGGYYHAPTHRYYVVADERNDERMNLYTLDLDSGALEPLTDNDYTYGFVLSDDYKTLAYVGRHGTAEPFNSCLYIRDIETDVEQKILCDEGGKDRFTWSGIEFSPKKDSVIVRVQHDGDRNTTNLARIDLTHETPSFEFLLERGIKHYSLRVLRDTLSADGFVFLSEKTGFDNLYRYDLRTGEEIPLTSFTSDISGIAPLDVNGSEQLLVILRRPYESELLVLDASSGEVITRKLSPFSIRVADYHDNHAVLTMSSVQSPFQMEWLSIDSAIVGRDVFEHQTMATLPEDLGEKIVHCEVERIEYPTFDSLEDGSPRMLHAYLFIPREELSNAERLVRITAFYGGGNFFRTDTQLMCEAGIATLSPAPRGSHGFGAQFAALNDGDLGGDEIIDLFYAARWLEENRGYQPHQIGVHGGSHGGYATMRALTFPPYTNERNEHFDFGFGLSHAGFSDIISFYETCNIPDWVILEAGDPATEAEKLRDRSPLNHVERLQAPLLLTHGENDSRVPVQESRQFAERAKALMKPVKYVEFEGQGHGIDGLDNRLRYYQAIFEFLENLPAHELLADTPEQ